MKIFFTGLLFGILFFSCGETISSKNIPTKKILRNYYAHTSYGTTTYITAEFFTEAGLTIPPFRKPYGKRITLEAPCKVWFNGQEMKYNKSIFGDVTYKIKLNHWPSKFKWVWKDKNGRMHTDAAYMGKIKLRKKFLIPHGRSYAVIWNGSPIRRGEEIAVTLKAGGQDLYQTSNSVGTQSIKMKGTGFGFHPSGHINAQISRTYISRRVRNISTEHVAGSFITLKYNDEKNILSY